MTKRSLGLVGVSMLALVVGCGSSDASPPIAPVEPAAPPATTPTPPPDDHGAPSTTYPAFQTGMPALQNKGGKVLASANVVTVAWNDSPNATQWEALVDQLGASQYWKDIVGEYGVGPFTSGAANHIRLTTPFAIPNDPNQDPVEPVVKLIVDSLSDTATSKWPEPTDQSLYILYFSGQTAQTLCDDGMGGMHDMVSVKGKDVAFAIVMECEGDPQMTAYQSATISTSHELAEAAVDPYPDASPGWQGLDEAHLAWELFQQGQDENGDLCEFYEDSYGAVAAPEISVFLQRQWSNKSVAAGHSPCVPARKDPYFNVTPLEASDDLTADFGKFDLPFSNKSKGIHIGIGETKKIPLGFFSDGPTDAIKLQAFEFDPFDDGPPPGDDPSAAPSGPPSASNKTLELTLDKDSGQNGEKSYLTVKVNKDAGLGVQIVLLQTTLGDQSHFMPFLVGGNPADPALKLGPDGTHGGTGGGMRALTSRRSNAMLTSSWRSLRTKPARR
jgi:hypothetical protein